MTDGMRFLAGAMLAALSISAGAGEIGRYVRYSDGSTVSYGQRDGEIIHQLDRAPWDDGRRTGSTVKADSVTLLAPAQPSKVFAVGFNFDSHRGDRVLPEFPPIFLKLPTAITGPGAEIVYPAGASNVHFEGELVVVIGKTASRVSADAAADFIFGVTAGNDVSGRDWQANDLQWFRAKASDTFGPIGPEIVTGLNYRDLLLQTRLNGRVVQEQRTSDHIHDVHAIVSFISQYATLYPGDLIFTGTPGETGPMLPGDRVEVEIENIGTLQNTIAAQAASN